MIVWIVSYDFLAIVFQIHQVKSAAFNFAETLYVDSWLEIFEIFE